MKRAVIILALVFLFAIAILFLTISWSASGNAPQFLAKKLPPPGNYSSVTYNVANPQPFVGGKVWVWAFQNTNRSHHYLFDLDDRLILGELFNGSAEFANQDGTKVLCCAAGPNLGSLQEWFAYAETKLSRGRIRHEVNWKQTF